ncbi:MAG: 3-keto-5-aminohexanoate cleavage protein [Ralstonia sp.]|uniref:3-keto-5-aminohexanoate cleavage protein n=1 Tax=Ralstonia pickettii TaxID=329 RepID=A0A2P4RNP0_RALPI|nr:MULTISPECIES: 3-keto-5-aminohexanoate cleavage protein [Ralstonia]MBA4202994.1 3-keto-5-aminohexanoate cleavage protein [Ralstonia sp.]MBA4231720.1 3-keto-5-aminohexanoate cleavage protein [Ralstonia sp.]MBA4237969.1 3-keto-5-aminohexanoate cleavage protein [Ralstonia sp.]MBA4279129.1 3-keto-5-aminohexanoate cleavage protein [Ralstonia sp.]MBA4294567.1 3-keto-5-aminohexanoate cleavage protein [Ralstonia sp.]
MTQPIAIAVAPNGARKTHADHPALPITPDELAACARQCVDAGAAMLHLHVRRPDGTHSLEPGDYRPAIAAVRHAVGDALVIQITTEAVGIYTPEQQMASVRALQPEAISAALRELAPDAAHEAEAARFFGELAAARTAIQYILYSADDVARYRDLRTRGVLPDTSHWVLFVLGRYSAGQHSDPTDLLQFLQAWADGGDLTANVPWAMCAFGPREAECALTAALLGGHARLGFENNMALPDGSTAPDNAALVTNLRRHLDALHRPLASAADLRSWFGR